MTIPLSIGGDHTITYPILRAMAERHGPSELVHVDAHADMNDAMFGEPIAHGSRFRRRSRTGCVDPERTAQIGVRGTGYAADDFDWSPDRVPGSCRSRSAGIDRSTRDGRGP